MRSFEDTPYYFRQAARVQLLLINPDKWKC